MANQMGGPNQQPQPGQMQPGVKKEEGHKQGIYKESSESQDDESDSEVTFDRNRRPKSGRDRTRKYKR
jgi:hypothetical protein